MKESLLIENFGPIRRIELHDIRPLSVIIGPSGSGKSTIMKVLVLFRWLCKMQHIRAYLKHSGLPTSPFRFRFDTYVKTNGWKGFMDKQSRIVYRYGDLELRHENGKFFSSRQIARKELHLEKLCFIADSRIAASQILSGRMRSDSFYLTETMNDFRLALEALEHYEVPYLDVRLVRRRSAAGVEYKIEGLAERKYSIPMTNASSGTQSLLPLEIITHYYATRFDMVGAFNKAVLNYVSDADKFKQFRPVDNIGDIRSRRVCLHIEEPELSLSPEKQVAWLNRLVADCFTQRQSTTDYEMGVFATTHSPYLINQLNLLMLAHEKGVLLEEKAAIDGADVELYRLTEKGELYSLKAEGQSFLDTTPLSEEINKIYDAYDQLL